MPRGRAQLTEKQERILVQCQLMGLTTSDMTKIANRLRAIDTERETQRAIDEAIAGFTWEVKGPKHFVITDSKGLVYECKDKTNVRKIGYYHKSYDLVITHPGTRMKPRAGELVVHTQDAVLARQCPENNKNLFRVCQGLKLGRIR